MRAALRILGTLAALAALIAVMAWLGGFFTPESAPAPAPAAAVPAGERLEVRSVREPRIEQATATVQARNETAVSSRILATIASIPVRAGDAVAQGETLVMLDSREFQARLEQARQSQAAGAARLAEARADYERIRSLYERRVVPRADLDRAQAVLGSQEAEFARARQAVDEAATALTWSTISAPFAGRVIDRLAEPGDTAVPGVPLVRLYDPARLRVEANVRESLATTLAVGQRLGARIDALDLEVPVAIEEIVPSADPGSRSFVVKAALEDQPNLYPGMFARLLIPAGSVERIYVPERAVTRVGQLEYVVAAEAGGAVRRFVRTGRTAPGGRIEVLSGLTTGETIVLAPE